MEWHDGFQTRPYGEPAYESDEDLAGRALGDTAAWLGFDDSGAYQYALLKEGRAIFKRTRY